MKNILIFKTDRVGDLINITPVINNIKLNYPNSKIDIICSKYNSQFAEFIKELNEIIIYEKSLYKFLKVNLSHILSSKYDVIFQLDGKTHSYFLSFLYKSVKKYSLRFIKQKKIFSLTYEVVRPNFFYQYFLNTIDCNENYNLDNNKSYHYLTLYLKLLDNAGVQIINKEHVFNFKPKKKVVKFNDEYTHFHIDEKWLYFDKNIHNNLIKLLKSYSSSKKIVISSNLGTNILFDNVYEKFKKNNNFLFFKSPNFSDIISIIYYANTCVSSHSGFIVHLASCYKKNIIDIVDSNIFNELDRWIPFNISYKRYDINHIENITLY